MFYFNGSNFVMSDETVFTAYIGERDPHEWLQGIGKAIIMPILLKVAEEVIYESLEEKQAARVEAQIRGKMKAFDFFVRMEGIEDTLDKVMEWALQEEEYEMCGKVKSLQERLQNENTRNWR